MLPSGVLVLTLALPDLRPQAYGDKYVEWKAATPAMVPFTTPERGQLTEGLTGGMTGLTAGLTGSAAGGYSAGGFGGGFGGGGGGEGTPLVRTSLS